MFARSARKNVKASSQFAKVGSGWTKAKGVPTKIVKNLKELSYGERKGRTESEPFEAMAKHMVHLDLRDSLFVRLRGNHPLLCFYLFVWCRGHIYT